MTGTQWFTFIKSFASVLLYLKLFYWDIIHLSKPAYSSCQRPWILCCPAPRGRATGPYWRKSSGETEKNKTKPFKKKPIQATQQGSSGCNINSRFAARFSNLILHVESLKTKKAGEKTLETVSKVTSGSSSYCFTHCADLRENLEHQEDLQTLHVNASVQQLYSLVEVVLSGQRNHQLQEVDIYVFKFH